jgi:hypothetical protein
MSGFLTRDMLMRAFPDMPRLWHAFEAQADAVDSGVQRLPSLETRVGVVETAVSSVGTAYETENSVLTALASLQPNLGVIEQVSTGTFATRPVNGTDAGSLITIAYANAHFTSSGTATVSSFNSRTGAITLTSGDVTTALTYTPSSVTGLTGVQTVAAFKTGLALVKGDVGLGNVDNTADVNKAVLSATKLATARTINGVSFDGTANITIATGAGGYTTTNRTTAYTETATSGDVVNFCSGSFTVTLPTAVGNTATLTYKVTGTGPITVTGAGGQTIDGSSSASVPLMGSLVLRSDNANWWVM